MAQYAQGFGLPVLVDFVDVDSAKWTEYAARTAGPCRGSTVAKGDQLLAYERVVAARSEQAFFVTEKEADLFRRLAPESAPRVQALGNGVDADYFAPDPARVSPFDPGETALVFTGAMDYWPNIDAVTWFVQGMLPESARPVACAAIAHRRAQPAAGGAALASEMVQRDRHRA